MQAIVTKYYPVTNYRPARIKVSCARATRFYSYHSLEFNSSDQSHRAACDRLCAEFDAKDKAEYGDAWVSDGNWSQPKAEGELPTGEHVFVFIPQTVANVRRKVGQT